jgi:hypothetical protein
MVAIECGVVSLTWRYPSNPPSAGSYVVMRAHLRRGQRATGTAGADAADDAAARQAAEVAVELSETSGRKDSGRKRKRAKPAGRTAGAVSAARRGAGSATRGVTSGMSWLTAQVLAMGPRLRIRDRATLRAQFPGQSDDEIAKALVERAARASGAVGGATGAWAALPALPAFPVEIAAETLSVVGIEVKLVAELHEVYGVPAAGSGPERARAYLASWATRRGAYAVDGGLLTVAGSPLARALTRRLAARVRRSTFSLAPLFTGAVAGAVLNRRDTRKLGHQMRDQLRQRQTTMTATVIR